MKPTSLICSLLLLLVISASSKLQAQEKSAGAVIPGRLMLRFEEGVAPGSLKDDLQEIEGKRTEVKVERQLSEYLNIWLFSYDPDSVDLDRLLQRAERLEGVLTAQPEHRMERRLTPNDPQFAQPDIWPYINDGSNGGVVDADIDADLAWDITTGGTTATGDTIVVAVIDGGFQIDHEDMNFFKNEAELNGSPGVDDDGNGYVDDVNGWDVYNSDGSISSDQHGSHVAGTVGAVGDNGIGWVGVNWDVEVMPIQGSSTNESTVVAAYDYVLKMRDLYEKSHGKKGAFIVATNSSFGVDGGDPSNYPMWCAMYDTLGAYGVTSAVAGPNSDVDIDAQGDVPGTCPSPHTLCVTNTQNDDSRGTAGYGEVNVDLGAPGTGILSTIPTDDYGELTGTSMATPHVAGTIGLLYSVDCPDLSLLAKKDPDSASRLVKEAILNGVDQTSAMTNITVSDGRLNAHKALLELDSSGACDTSGSPCYEPYFIDSEQVSDSSVVFSYHLVGGEDSVEVQYKKASAASWTSLYTSNPDSLELDGGLDACTDYDFRVRAYCGGSATDWAGPLSFETLACCDPPKSISLMSQGNTELHLKWDSLLAASAYQLKLRPADSTDWDSLRVEEGNDTLLKGLEKCQGYEFKVRSDCDTGYSSFSSIASFNTLCAPCDSSSYCASAGQNVDYEWIEAVDIAGLSNGSGNNDGYLFKGGPNTRLKADSSYIITLTPGYSGTSYPEYFRIWVDLNRNGTFETPGEKLYESSSVTSSVTDTLDIPASLSEGGARMRVSMRYDNLPSVCGGVDNGEVEDYCVLLRSGDIDQGIDRHEQQSGFELYPNPARDRVLLRSEQPPEPGTSFILYDALGNKIMERSLKKRKRSFDISHLSEGTYFYRIVGPAKRTGGSLIVKDR